MVRFWKFDCDNSDLRVRRHLYLLTGFVNDSTRVYHFPSAKPQSLWYLARVRENHLSNIPGDLMSRISQDWRWIGAHQWCIRTDPEYWEKRVKSWRAKRERASLQSPMNFQTLIIFPVKGILINNIFKFFMTVKNLIFYGNFCDPEEIFYDLEEIFYDI